MNQNNISELPYLNTENYENVFSVNVDDNGYYYYNLLQSISLQSNLPKGFFTEYIIQYGDTWPYISYKVYNTPNLWWLILPFNNIQNPTKIPEPGTPIKILQIPYVKQILSQLKTQQ